MKRFLLISLALITIVAFGIVTYMYSSGYFYFYFDNTDYRPLVNEKVAFTNAYLKTSTVYLDVHSIAGNITFIDMLIKNADGDTVNKIPFSNSLLEGQSKIISANFEKTLTSGNYTVYLITTKGSAFVSPSFTVP